MVPTRGPVDARIRSAPYDGDQVYRVRGFVGYQIDFEFEPGETFVGLGAGDIEALSYFGQDNHLFLKPKAAKVATNLTVLTNRRRYQIDYTAVRSARAPSDPDVMFAVRFIYPPVPAQSAAERSGEAHRCGARAKPRPRARGTSITGTAEARELKPTAASDDGIHTRLRFAANADLPGSLRSQRRRHRIAAQLQHGCRRRHHSSRRAPVRSEARQAHRLRRQSGIRRQRPAARVGHGHAGGASARFRERRHEARGSAVPDEVGGRARRDARESRAYRCSRG